MWPTAVEHISFHAVQILSSPIFLIHVHMCINIYIYVCLLLCVSHTYADTCIYKIKSRHLELKTNPNSAVTHKLDLPGFQEDLTLFLTVWLLWILAMRKIKNWGSSNSCKKCKASDETGHYILQADVVKLLSCPLLMPLLIEHLSPP